MKSATLTLTILLPSEIFVHQTGVMRVVAETQDGSFGLLPNRLDCTAALTPGILTYETVNGSVMYVAVDAGVLVKSGSDVIVSVRSALGGTDLSRLHEAVEREFLTLDAQEKDVQTALAKMESGFVRRFAEFVHESQS